MSKTIKFYRVKQYGVWREYVHPDCAGDSVSIFRLTGQKTINSVVREALRDLFCGALQWQEVVAPSGEWPVASGKVRDSFDLGYGAEV